MARKHRIRELAMQVLFLWDTHGQADQELASQLIRDACSHASPDASQDASIGPPAINMADGAWKQREMIDQRLERIAPHWPPRRQPGVDRSILRLAVWELTNTDTPPKVVLDEAIELAKHFSTEQSPAFINGVLDAILKEHRTLTEGLD